MVTETVSGDVSSEAADGRQGELACRTGYWTPVELRRKRSVLQGLGDGRFHSILDLGCGKGQFTVGVCESLGIPSPVGVELSPDSVHEARQRGVQAICLDLNHDQLPFPSESFDLVMMIEALEHLEDCEHCLDEARRVLKPYAPIVVTTPNLASWHGRVSLMLGFQPLALDVGFRKHYGGIVTLSGRSTGHIRGFTRRALTDMLCSNGFTVESVRSSEGVATGDAAWIRFLRLVDRVMSTFPGLGSGLVVVARKSK